MRVKSVEPTIYLKEIHNTSLAKLKEGILEPFMKSQ